MNVIQKILVRFGRNFTGIFTGEKTYFGFVERIRKSRKACCTDETFEYGGKIVVHTVEKILRIPSSIGHRQF